MFIRSFLKNKKYIISKRNYLDDYSNNISKKIDMTMSGKYLGKYPDININSLEFDKYPISKDINVLVNTIKNKYSIKNEIIIGNGSNGILQNLIKIYVGEKDNLVTPYYTFNQAEYAVTSQKGYTKRVLMDEENINLDNIIDSIDKKTKLVYICNPNNPTGIYVSSKELLCLSEKIYKKNKNIKLIIDESSIEFTKEKSLLDYKLPSNIIVLRTFSKAYGIANLRIGYMVCHRNIYNKYIKNTTNNEISSVVSNIANTIIKTDLYKENIDLIIKERELMIGRLNELGIKCYKSNSNIIMTKTTFSKKEIEIIEDNDISLVNVLDINNKIHLRIAIQDEKTNREFISILKKIINK